MRKVADVTTPKRGRPPKKQLITPKSAPAATGEAASVPQNGAKSSNIQVSSKQANSSGSRRKNLSVSKRNGNRSASVDSSGIIIKKRRQKSPEKAVLPSEKTSTPSSSRASSKEKVETLLSKTVKQEALKVAQSLESTAKRISRRGKLQGVLSAQSQKKKTKAIRKKSRKSEPIKDLKNDIHINEIKRLSTTDGFWSSKTPSRSNSPLGQPLEPTSQKQTHSLKDSRTSTPDISPSSTKRQPITKIRSDEDVTTPKPNNPVSELRRLRTTEGFSFRDSAVVTPITDSRDASPTSAPSLERLIRQNAKLLGKSNEQKNVAKNCDVDQNVVVNDIPQGKLKMKNKKTLNDVNGKLSDLRMDTSDTVSQSSSTLSIEQAFVESPVSRLQKRNRKSSFIRGFNKRPRQKMTSVLPICASGESSIDQAISTSISIPEVQGKVRQTRRSGVKRVIKNSPKKARGGLKRVKHKLNADSLELVKPSGDASCEDFNTPVVGDLLLSDVDSSVKATSVPEFAISDLLDSAELKRLNTTAGFWASMPDISTVLSKSYHRRLRDTDSSSTRGSCCQLTLKNSEQSKELPKFKASPVKSQSTLLQHRKKRLQALQNSLRKIKQQISIDEVADQNKMCDNTSQTAVAACEQKPDPIKRIGAKKRSYKTRSKLVKSDQGKVLEVMDQSKEQYESVEAKGDTKDSSLHLDLNVDAVETTGPVRLELKNNKKPHDLSGPEVSTSFTDSLLQKKTFVKTWKRGRRKVVHAAAKLSASPTSIKTRGRGKVDSCVQSLEVLQNLEPNREDKLFSASHDTSKVGKEKKKLKRPKKKSLPESDLNVSNVDIDKLSPHGADDLQTIDTEGKDIDTNQQLSSIFASVKTDNPHVENHSVMSRQSSGHKKYNLFESLAFDLLMPSDVPSINVSTDVSVDSSFNATVEPQVVIKPDVVMLMDNCDHSGHDVPELKIKALTLTDPEFNETKADQSGRLDATDDKAVTVNKELIKDIPVQTNSNASPSHSLAAVLPVKVQSLDQSLVVQKTEQNFAASETKIDIAVVNETASECDPFIGQGKDILPTKTIVTSKNDESTLGEPDTGDVFSQLAQKSKVEIGIADNPESSISYEDKSEDVRDIIGKEEMIKSVESSLNHHISVENESVTCAGGIEHDLAVGNTSHHNISTVNEICNPIKGFNQHESLTNVIADNDRSLKSGEEKPESISEEMLVFKCVEQDEMINSGSEIVSDNLSGVALSAGLHSSESKVEENILVDISDAPLGLVKDGAISPLPTAQPSAETVGLKRRRKRKKQMARLINSILNTDIASHSTVESEMPVCTFENTEETADGDVGENLIVTTTLPAIEQLKRQKKRRRNAWQRGVLKKASSLSRKNSKQRQLLNSGKCLTPAPGTASVIEEGTSIASAGAQVEITGHQYGESYTPAIKKSLSNLLKKLETNANLANAVLVEQPYKGRFLRKVQPQEQKEKQLKVRRKEFNSGSSAQPIVDSVKSLPGDTTETPKDWNVSGTIKRKRGRPKKQRDESFSRLETFPRLTPLHNLPTLRPVTPWNTMPPNLSPQAIASHGSGFFDMGELKNAPDPDFVCESVDDTDLHLYLSGVSDEELSPKKELHPVSDMEIRVDTPVSQEKKCDVIRLETIKESSLNIEDTSTAQEAVQVCGPELIEIVKPKFKGRKGRPPGIPMTEEEKRQKVQKSKLSPEMRDEQDSVESLGTSQKSAITPEVCGPPAFMGTIVTPAAKFSLREKSTRSPLEMLAMKRKQEEARYDLEQEKRQARLLHLREMRSARESGDGLSDDGDGGLCPENLSLCSVVLSDFVKKLQLDDVEASSYEEPNHQPAESTSEESPEYNGDEEDWCADLEEHGNEDRNDSRPYIPRLKLKRVIKKGISSHSKRVALRKQQLDEKHEPIKLVIKTEPSSEQSEQVGAKSSVFVEPAKVDKPSFENSYLDYLREKNQSEKSETPRRRHNISRHTNIETSRLNVTDLGSAEILTLPMPGVKDSSIRIGQGLVTDIDKTASIDEHQSVSSLVRVVASTPHLPEEDTAISHADNLSRFKNVEATKRLSSGDEEEDDILILDLDDGAVDQNSEDTFRDNLPQLSGCLSVTPGRNSPHRDNAIIVSKKNDSAYLVYPSREDKSDGDEVRRSTFRSYSNDEMGLMFESYNSEEDKSADNHSQAAKNVAVISASSESNTETQIQEISHSVTSILMESDSGHRNKVKNVQQPQTVADISDDSFLSSETTTKDTSNLLSSGSAIDTLNPDHLDESHMIRQLEITRKDKEQSLIEVVSGNIEDNNSEDTSSLSQSESLPAISEKTVVDGSSDISTLDNNNVTQTFKHVPKVTVPVKKSGIVSDSSKSPKHSTYHESGPEEWKVKIILHSDKFPSGKYSCKRCGFTTPSKLTIESHIYSHIPGVQFRCAYCESEFSSMAATSSHLKNTHSLNEAKLHISRHIDEKNFYDKEAAIYSEESSQHSTSHGTCANTASGGQSPPVIISVVVSGGVTSSRSGRPAAPPRRFVCTHCGFSTNVKEDAEHHVLDLHSSQSLFACLLCSENVCYTEREIKDHCATVHPARHLPYRKLPDFYDAEQLNLKDKAALQDDRENIFERMTSIFQDDSQTGTNTIDHRQKAKEYLFLQEGWREKTRVEADSTTAVDYTEESSAPQTPTPELSIDEGAHQADATENEASDHDRTASETATGLCTTAALSDDSSITSSARSAITISSVNSQVVISGLSPETPSQQTVESKEETLRETDKLTYQSHPEGDEQNEEICELSHQSLDDNDDDSEDIGLKIIQVVSLSGQEEDIVDEQISQEQPQPEEVDAGVPTESHDNCLTVASPSEATLATPCEAHELLAPEHLASTEETVTQKDTEAHTTLDGLKSSSQSDVAAESPAAGISTASSSAASPSFAGGLPLSYKCNACKVHTPYLLMMVKHLKARHPNMRCFSCPYCKTTHSFVSQKQLRHHVKQSHPNKFGRNEIALSEDAKKFVEAMVLPIGPECIRVGSRIVLEEDIHTCTYCQVKMISLANVYEHLNTKHSDLFEFVCPVCQSFKNKKLTEISEHCLKTHKSSLDTDKVHVSVPKNLFTALTCISKNGKYIEKTLIGGAVISNIDKACANSSTATFEQPQKMQSASVHNACLASGASPMENAPPAAVHSPLRLTTLGSSPTAPAGIIIVSTAQTNQPLFSIPLMSTGVGAVPVTRTVVAFSSSLFDTSSLAATPHMTVAPQSSPVFQNAGASSFLSPIPQPAHLNSSNSQPSKQQPPVQLQARPNERVHAPAKNLPVLNVPTIKPRASSQTTKSVAAARKTDDHSLADKVPKSTVSTSSSIASLLTTSTSQAVMRSASSSSCLDNLPDDEPNPDAFKIFNLRPSSTHASPTVSPGVSSVFPPSSPITSSYLQGPITGFPPGMIIPPNFLPLSFSPQHQPIMQGMLAQKHGQRSSPLSRHPRLPYPSSGAMSAQSPPTVRSIITQHEPTTAAAVYLKKQQQQRELYLLKKQHQLIRQNQQQAVPRAHPAHQQPPSLSGQVYQPQPLPISPLSFDQRSLPGHSDFSQSSLYLPSVLVSSTSTAPSSSAPLTATHSSPSRPSKGVHKRSSSLYQCPYCPVLVTLRALDVASHIQQNHPGKQVAFRKIV